MENSQVTLEKVHAELQNLKEMLKKRGVLDNMSTTENNEIIWDWPQEISVFADEILLSEDWLSKEDEEVWKDL